MNKNCNVNKFEGHFLIVGDRLSRNQKKILINKGFDVNDLRTWDNGRGSTIEPHVLVNHEGTIITDVPIIWDVNTGTDIYVKNLNKYVKKNNLSEFTSDSDEYIFIMNVVDDDELNFN